MHKSIASQKQDRQTVDKCDTRTSHHVQCAGPDRRCRNHNLLATSCLCKTYCGKSHTLFVLATIGLDIFSIFIESHTKARHVAMTKNRQHPGKQLFFAPVDQYSLGDKKLDQSLSSR